jgi:hypothetical protein
MQPVAASRKSSPQVFSSFNIAVMNDYIFLTEAAMPQKAPMLAGALIVVEYCKLFRQIRPRGPLIPPP